VVDTLPGHLAVIVCAGIAIGKVAYIVAALGTRTRRAARPLANRSRLQSAVEASLLDQVAVIQVRPLRRSLRRIGRDRRIRRRHRAQRPAHRQRPLGCVVPITTLAVVTAPPDLFVLLPQPLPIGAVSIEQSPCYI